MLQKIAEKFVELLEFKSVSNNNGSFASGKKHIWGESWQHNPNWLISLESNFRMLAGSLFRASLWDYTRRRSVDRFSKH